LQVALRQALGQAAQQQALGQEQGQRQALGQEQGQRQALE
jgi:hypothetical protein